jgi:hypothetical protein
VVQAQRETIEKIANVIPLSPPASAICAPVRELRDKGDLSDKSDEKRWEKAPSLLSLEIALIPCLAPPGQQAKCR